LRPFLRLTLRSVQTFFFIINRPEISFWPQFSNDKSPLSTNHRTPTLNTITNERKHRDTNPQNKDNFNNKQMSRIFIYVKRQVYQASTKNEGDRGVDEEPKETLALVQGNLSLE
jgi:hypothetical protein